MSTMVFGTYRQGDLPPTARYSWHPREAEDWVGETLGTVEFLPDGGAARVVITQEGFPTADASRTRVVGVSTSRKSNGR